MLNIALIGCGAIGQALLQLIIQDQDLRVTHIVVPAEVVDNTRKTAQFLAKDAQVQDRLPTEGIDLVVEAAGHEAIKAHVLDALSRGTPAIIASSGALSEDGLVETLEAAARKGQCQVHLISGAMGAVDAIASAGVGGLDSVVYTGRKPPKAWLQTPAEKQFDLEALTEPTVIFTGSARDAAREYPKNANVASTISLAGLGLDTTQVQLIADPSTSSNTHTVQASGAFGELSFTMSNRPLPQNPKTSALTVYSLVRTIRNLTRPLVI